LEGYEIKNLSHRWAYLICEPRRQTQFHRRRTPNSLPCSWFLHVAQFPFHVGFGNRLYGCLPQLCVLQIEASCYAEVERKSRDRMQVDAESLSLDTPSCTSSPRESMGCRMTRCRRPQQIYKTGWFQTIRNAKRECKGQRVHLRVGLGFFHTGTVRGIIYAVQVN
jgi:hypothetical protein